MKGGDFENMDEEVQDFLKRKFIYLNKKLDANDEMIKTLSTIESRIETVEDTVVLDRVDDVANDMLNNDLLKLGALVLAATSVVALAGFTNSIQKANNYLEPSVIGRTYPTIQKRDQTTMRTRFGSEFRKRSRQVYERNFYEVLETERNDN